MLRLRPRLGLGTAALAALVCLTAAPRDAAAAPTARFNHTMSVLADGNTLVVGGEDAAPLSTVGIYISTGAKWETRASLPAARSSHTATVLPDGRLLVAGGYSNAASAANCNSDGVTVICRRGAVFDPVTNAWTNTGNEMDVARINHTATLLPSGKVLIAGGQTDAAGSVTTDCDLFNPATNNFEACGSGLAMQMARAGHSATLLDNGRVFVAGGYRAIGSGFAPTTEIYNPTNDTWTSGPAMVEARAYHSATQMGNQRVLIAGGYNARNVKENLGILSTAEIYDPNSNTISPAAPMAERKLFHTANLLGTGNVDVFGGLGNITTSYFSQSLTLQPNSVLAAAAVNGFTWLEATASGYSTSDLRILPDTVLSVAASGIVVDGYIDFSSPVVQGTQFKADLTYPAGTRASLARAAIDSGKLRGQTFSVTTLSGQVHFTPQDANADDLLITAGSIPNAGGLPPATVTAFTGASITGNLRVKGMPKEFVNGSVVRGRAIIKGGSITKASDDATQGYDVTLDSGIATIDGAVILNDPTDGPTLILNGAAFTSVSGDITSSTSTTNVANPINIAALKVTALQLQLLEIVSPLQVADIPFSMDIATVVIRNMIFADQERYQPNQNVWQFGVPGDALFSHAQTLLPNGDEFVFGGRLCTSFTNCTNYSFTSQTLNFAYILTQQGVTPWSSVGDLSVPRSNHTLTLLPDGRVLAAGGADATSALTASEVMNATTRVWSRTADMKQRRSHHTAALLPNGNVLVAGGFTALTTSTGTTRHAEIFYPGTDSWVPTAPMISSRAYAGLVLLPDGNPFVMGGFADGAYLSSTEIFYSTGHRWVAGPSMPEARAQYTATILRDGRVMVTGGLNAASGVLNTTRFYNPATNSWSSPAGTNLNYARHSHTATMLRDGRVLVVGGNGGTGEIAQAEIFDPTLNAGNGQWQRVDADLGGNDLGIPRLGHSATLLPDGKVMVVGGFTALGGPIIDGEGFDVDFSSFQMQGKLNKARGDHATVLMKDGFLLAAGGFDGLNYTGTCEILYGGGFPDASTLAGGIARRPRIDEVRPSIFTPGSPVSAIGANFKGLTEASGGGGGKNSSHPTPRVWLQRYDSASNSANDSGWQVDLGSAIARAQNNAWSSMDSSITFTVPSTSATLPLGWYGLRVSANDQFSPASSVQVGPRAPTGTPGVPVGTAVGPSSVVWTWGAAGGAFDGYSVYSATNGVFLSTIAASGGASETFLQTGLGPDTSSLIKVAAYNVSGDGQVVFATVPVLTTVSALNGLQGIAQNEQTIFWSWDPISGATSYDVFSATTGLLLSSPLAASYTQSNLSTNTAYGVMVRAILPGGPGTLSSAATAYTLAAIPTAGTPAIGFVSTGSIVGQWLANSNPNTTRYHVKMLVGTSTDVIHISSIQAITAGITGLTPNTQHQLSVAAFNGDGKYTSFVSLGSTYTFARPPSNAVVTHVDPSAVTVQWDPNGNPGSTPYQVLYSTDNFVSNVSTFIAFAANYTTATANVNPLITSVQYTFRITAQNAFGQQTSAASTQAVTDNGGGPAGSLSILVPTTVYTTLSGTLGSGRKLVLTIPVGTFSQQVRVFISSRALADLHCGNIAAGISITTLPSEQPRYPVEVGLQYNPAEANIGAMATLGMTRYDPVSGACVPMQSRNDTANSILYASLNHFSDFQLTQLAPYGSVETARVFPNPLYTHTQAFFTFDHVPAGSRVRVYTIHGEEVFDQEANASGVVTWRAENKVGRPVASGLYLAVLESGGGKKILKLAVVR